MKRILGPQGTIRSHRGKALLALLVGALANGNVTRWPQNQHHQRRSVRASPGCRSTSSAIWAKAPEEVQFLAHGPAYAIAITEQGAALTLGGAPAPRRRRR